MFTILHALFTGWYWQISYAIINYFKAKNSLLAYKEKNLLCENCSSEIMYTINTYMARISYELNSFVNEINVNYS